MGKRLVPPAAGVDVNWTGFPAGQLGLGETVPAMAMDPPWGAVSADTAPAEPVIPARRTARAPSAAKPTRNQRVGAVVDWRCLNQVMLSLPVALASPSG